MCNFFCSSVILVCFALIYTFLHLCLFLSCFLANIGNHLSYYNTAQPRFFLLLSASFVTVPSIGDCSVALQYLVQLLLFLSLSTHKSNRYGFNLEVFMCVCFGYSITLFCVYMLQHVLLLEAKRKRVCQEFQFRQFIRLSLRCCLITFVPQNTRTAVKKSLT